MVGFDVLPHFLAAHQPEPHLHVRVAEPEPVRHQPQLLGVRIVAVLDPPVVGAAGGAERAVDVLGFDVAVEQVVEKRLELAAVLVGPGHHMTHRRRPEITSEIDTLVRVMRQVSQIWDTADTYERMVAVIPPHTVRASSWITDYLVTGSPAPTDIAGLSNPLDDVLRRSSPRRRPIWRRPPARSCWPRSAGRSRARSVTVGSTWMSTSTATANQATGRVGLLCTAQRDLSATTLLSAGREALRTVEPGRGRPDIPGRRPVQLPHGVPRACAGHRSPAGAARLPRPRTRRRAPGLVV